MTGRKPFRLIVTESQSWKERAACLGTEVDVFFPQTKGRRGNSPKVLEAKKVCAGCPVREDCLDYAISNGETAGVWGGHDRAERDRIAARRRRVGA